MSDIEPEQPKLKAIYVRFSYMGGVVGFGWIFPTLWPTKLSGVAWEEINPLESIQENKA